MPLEEYVRKRDFTKTPEPAGAPGSGTGRFVVQRHRATRLHYDFRLEIEGVLVSWAVPRGPTLDHAQRRMAVHVEDHPIEYFDFEGVIPKGQYGAGDVIVWDWGTFEPETETPDPKRAVANGELKFVLHGRKLRGRFTIVRTSRRPGSAPSRAFEDDEAEQWLLIKKRDADAVPGWDAEDHPQSVRTGRTNDEVRDNRDALWTSDAPASRARIELEAAVDAPFPGFVEPMAATLASTPFTDPDWLFEIKWDGYRVEAVVRDGTVRLYTRHGHDAATYFPGFLGSPSWIDAREAVVDGEVVALDDDGRPDFGLLQERISSLRSGRRETGVGLVYEAFDLLYLDGRSLLAVPLEDRKRLLRSVLRDSGRVRFASHVDGDGVAFHRAAAAQGVEGIVAKLRRSRYEPGRRSPAWLKIKIRPEQELVVGGWTPGEGNARDLGAVIVGVYEGERLRYAGKVGSGFRGAVRTQLRRRLAELAVDDPPFDPPPPRIPELRAARWVRPELVIRAELGGWSRDNLVRQAAFKGLEDGRDPRDVVRERAVDTARAVDQAEASAGPAAGRSYESVRSGDAPPNPIGSPKSDSDSGTNGRDQTPRSALSSPKSDSEIVRSPEGTPRSAPSRPNSDSDFGTHDPARNDSPGRTKSERAARAAAAPATAKVTRAELEALAALPNEGLWEVGGETLKLTNLDKVLFPPRLDHDEPPVTKRELIRYFALIAPAMLPHLANRALNLQRFPNGAGAPGFWQKDIPGHAPAWLTRWRETGLEGREDRDANDHLIADRLATLAWLGNQAAFEIHAWTSRIDDPWRPTFALIDIDPGERTTWDDTLTIARLYRTAFEHLGVRAYPKTTGKRGIQAWIPLVPGRYEYAETSAWVERLSRAVGASVPELVSWEWAKAGRKGRARLDYTQNASIKTLVAPYAVRPAAGAPVSAPITWDELDDPKLRPDRWTIRDLPERVDRIGDVFAGAQTDAQELPRL
ncbi:MAG TPA: non-homologous end-joining DNA ligase [Candidatus Limnocylindrales bacterium]|nr:non-homologous end-joining DNA ligase [Candidatus Limnocylindrales bacterium]